MKRYLLLVFLGLSTRLAADIPANLKTDRVLDFETEPAMAITQYEYRLSGPADTWIYTEKASNSILSSNGSTALYIGTTDGPITLSHLDGTEFQLTQMDLAEYSTVTSTRTVRFAGWKSDGTEVDFTFTLDGVRDGTGPAVDFQTAVFPTEWTGLIKVEIQTGGIAVDNIHVRGMKVENFKSSISSSGILSAPSLLAQKVSSNYWSVVSRIDASHLVLLYQDPWTTGTLCRFNLNTNVIEASYPVSSSDGADPATGMTASVRSGVLKLTDSSGTRTVASAGQDSVTAIGYPAVSNGKVAFINHYYDGETYAVFMADSGGVRPIVKPDTILSDGDTPRNFPYELIFRQNTLAFKTSTRTSGVFYLVSFNQGTPVIAPGTGTPMPGLNRPISDVGSLLWLDDQSIGYIVSSTPQSNNSVGNYPTYGVMILHADGRVEGYPVPQNLVKTVIPGAGCVERVSLLAGFDRDHKIPLSGGAVECLDLAPNNLMAVVAHNPLGASVLVREGDPIPGSGTILHLSQRILVDGDSFYMTCLSSDGNCLLLKGKIPVPAAPLIPSLDSPAASSDGTVRLSASHLTMGRTYRIERSNNLNGPWQQSSRFVSGSQSRSVLGAMNRQSQDFFRLVEE